MCVPNRTQCAVGKPLWQHGSTSWNLGDANIEGRGSWEFPKPKWQCSVHCMMTTVYKAFTREEDELNVDVMDRLDRMGI